MFLLKHFSQFENHVEACDVMSRCKYYNCCNAHVCLASCVQTAGRCFQLLALLLAVMAAISLGLGVAHFISTYFLLFDPASPYCNKVLSGCSYAEQVVYAFIMPGVWGSAAVRIKLLCINFSVIKLFSFFCVNILKEDFALIVSLKYIYITLKCL